MEGFADCDAAAPGCEASTSAKESCGACGVQCATSCVTSEGQAFCNEPIEISAGYAHTCALRKDGSVWCWGRNEYGELGMDAGSAAPGVPTLVPLPDKAVAMVAGGGYSYAVDGQPAHTCAILKDTTVYCWGAGTVGQLGRGFSQNSAKPEQVVSLVNITQLALGAAHTCALKSDGQLYCWGLNTSGQVGKGMNSSEDTPLPIIGGIKQVGAGYSHTCAVTTGGALLCWGRNQDGQLGNGSSAESMTPVAAEFKLPVDEVAGGDRHTCARVAQEIYCFGNDYNGAVGVNQFGPVTVPTLIAVAMVTSMDLGRERTGAVTGENGQLKMWGIPPLGNEMGEGASTPVDIGVTDVARLSLGGEHMCALKKTGEVLCWGENAYGQLGNGTPSDVVLTPTAVVWP